MVDIARHNKDLVKVLSDALYDYDPENVKRVIHSIFSKNGVL